MSKSGSEETSVTQKTNLNSNSDSPPRKILKTDAYQRQEIVSHTHEFTEEIQVLDYHTLDITDKSKIPRILDLLKDYKVDQFINRVNGPANRILIAPSFVDISDFKKEIYSLLGDEVEFFVQPVPSTRPVLRCQYEKTKALWPVKFVARKEYEDVFQKKILDENEAEDYSKLFEHVDGRSYCIIYNDERKEIVAEVEDDPEVLCGHGSLIVSDRIAEYCQKSEERYHAQGCTAIMSMEPCVMCAMALNHLRIRRVFFLKPNRRRGAFTRKINLTEGWDSHHYYGVFQMIIVKDCCEYDTKDNPFFTEFEELPKVPEIHLGILMDKSPAAAFVVDVCYRRKYTFVFLPQKPLKHCFEMIEKFEITHVVSEGVGDGLGNPLRQFLWEGRMYYFYFLNRKSQGKKFELYGDDWIAYGVRTSGTTGEPKTIFVPFSSIFYNIKYFSKEFKNEIQPTILWNSGVSFDTSCLELLLAFSTDGRLVIPPENFDDPFGKFDSDKIPKVDFFQTTPTKLLTSNESKLFFIFESQKVRRLYVGGEHFPLKFISKRKKKKYPEIWNIYGLTEVSCWSTIKGPLEEDDFENQQVSIGSDLYGHRTEVEDGKVVVNGPPTIINGLLRFCSYSPGDSGFVGPEDGEIYVVERGILKPNGIRFSSEAEKALRDSGSFPGIFEIRSLVVSGCPILVLIAEESSKKAAITLEAEKLLIERLPREKIPTSINVINRNEIHIDPSGKINIPKSIGNEHKITVVKQFVNRVVNEFGRKEVDIHKIEEEMISFLGFDSLRLLELSNLICCLGLSSSKDPIEVYNHLKKSNYQLAELYHYLKSAIFDKGSERVTEDMKDTEVINVTSDDLKEWQNWTKLTDICSTKSCIEATPLLHNSRLYFGDMTGKFYVCGIGTCEDKKVFDFDISSRFPESPILVENNVVAMTNDGVLITVNTEDLEMSITVLSKAESVTPLVSYGKYIFYGKKTILYKLNIFDLEDRNFLDIETTFSSRPLLKKGKLFVGGHSGFHIINPERMETIHKISNDVPILRPIFDLGDAVGVVDVQGDFRVFDPDTLEPFNLGFVSDGLDDPYFYQTTNQLFFGSDGILSVKILIQDEKKKITLKNDRSYVFPPHIGKLRKPIQHGNYLLILDSYGNLLVHDLHSKEFYEFRSGEHGDHSFSGSVIHLDGKEPNELVHLFFGSRKDTLKSWTFKAMS